MLPPAQDLPARPTQVARMPWRSRLRTAPSPITPKPSARAPRRLWWWRCRSPPQLGHQGAALGTGDGVRHVVSWRRNSPDHMARAGRRLRQTKRAGIPAGPRAM